VIHRRLLASVETSSNSNFLGSDNNNDNEGGTSFTML
jgi:hypothetical protein